MADIPVLEIESRICIMREPVTSDIIFPIASLTKGFTGACIDKLRGQGKLSFDDLVQKHLPSAKSQDPVVAADATISDLLGHRTGLQKADDIWLGAHGKMLIGPSQLSTVFSSLQRRASLRSQFQYNNICFALLGEIIAKVSGQPYHQFLRENILDPLNMTRTVVDRTTTPSDNVSSVYSIMDDGHPHNVPLPELDATSAIGPAGGLSSTVNDLVIYSKALMKCWQVQNRRQAENGEISAIKPVFSDVSWLFAPLQIMGTPTAREKAYAAGWCRSQLPGAVGDIGVNSGLVKKMPELASGIQPRLAIWHQGSLVGATSFIMILPETESAVIVLSNTMSANDASDWIGQMLVEALLHSPSRNDYVQLAAQSVDTALKKYADLDRLIEEGRQVGGPRRDLNAYVGSYVGFGSVFRITVVESNGDLAMLFQGLESQKFQLKHHHDDTFTWFMSWNDQIKRARFISYRPSDYSIRFEEAEERGIVSLRWSLDPAVPEGQRFMKE
ncbi:beta-lactamase/transpeptidase-like protein [Nemania sp. FL0916]|nr:beta-lactamase/transpeptidase-like protein [Nemania sp. FL0916]